MDFPIHETGTCIAIEGPRFSTRAEVRIQMLFVRNYSFFVILKFSFTSITNQPSS